MKICLDLRRELQCAAMIWSTVEEKEVFSSLFMFPVFMSKTVLYGSTGQGYTMPGPRRTLYMLLVNLVALTCFFPCLSLTSIHRIFILLYLLRLLSPRCLVELLVRCPFSESLSFVSRPASAESAPHLWLQLKKELWNLDIFQKTPVFVNNCQGLVTSLNADFRP